jgi:hypothetical protein
MSVSNLLFVEGSILRRINFVSPLKIRDDFDQAARKIDLALPIDPERGREFQSRRTTDNSRLSKQRRPWCATKHGR